MCRVKAKVKAGAVASERVAYIVDASGIKVEVLLSTTQTGTNHIVVGEVARDSGRVLIELPQEASSGDWRIWVKESQLLAK